MACTPQYAMKKPDSAPHSAAITTASATACQMLNPKSCHATPMVMEVRPTMEAT